MRNTKTGAYLGSGAIPGYQTPEEIKIASDIDDARFDKNHPLHKKYGQGHNMTHHGEGKPHGEK